FENLGGGKFRDITAQAGVGYVGHSSGAVFFDYDGDGLLDLFVTNVGVYTSNTKGPGGYYVGLPDAFHGHTHPERAETSILYRNLGGNRFEDVTRRVGLLDSSWSGDATVIDVNDDGWPDLYLTHVGVYTSNTKGPGGYYVGLPDAFHGHTHPERAETSILYRNLGGNRFEDVTRRVGLLDSSWSGDATVIDVNDDGWPDLY